MEKIIKEKIEKMFGIIKAFENGQAIELQTIGGTWVPAKDSDIKEICLNCVNCYRIKPKSSYRAYQTLEEFFHDQELHGYYIQFSETVFNIPKSVFILDGKVIVECETPAYAHLNADDLLNYRWKDGTPCGIKEL